MTYQIVEGETLEDLQNGVNEKLRQGFQPIGGIVSTSNGYAQAVLNPHRKTVAPQVEPS